MAEATNQSAPHSLEGSATLASDPATAELERLVWQELRECYDPEIPINIVELGLIYAMRSEPLPPSRGPKNL